MNEQLHRENERLKHRLEQAQTIIEFQKSYRSLWLTIQDRDARERLMHAVEELSHRVGVAADCTALEIPRASFYRRPAWQAALGSSAAVATDEGLPGSSSTSPRALKREEHQAVLTHMHSERFVDRLCSVRTLYRILDAHKR